MGSGMTRVQLGGAAIVVNNPPATLLEGLRRFNGSTGEYENLYSLSFNGHTMLTMPGFAERIRGLCPGATFWRAKKIPPDIAAATDGLAGHWRGLVRKVLTSRGGIVCLPDVFGEMEMVTAIVRAFPHEQLVYAGAAMTIVVVPDKEMAQNVTAKLRELFPGRDVGYVSARKYSDTDDILVTTYGHLRLVGNQPVGVLIACGLADTDVTPFADALSSVQSVIRFGLHSTPLGEAITPDMVMEGLIGQVVTNSTYMQAVDTGMAVPITVCWLPAPAPKAFGTGSFEMIEAQAMQENPVFCSLVASLANEVPSDLGVIVSTNRTALAIKVAQLGKLIQCNRKTPVAQRRSIRNGLIDGVIRRMVATYELPLKTDLGVMILASCEGASVVGKRIPWRKKMKPRDRAFIVDFRHSWDLHNGRPGYLARNDEARARRYTELGFRQMYLDSVNQLPFIGG